LYFRYWDEQIIRINKSKKSYGFALGGPTAAGSIYFLKAAHPISHAVMHIYNDNNKFHEIFFFKISWWHCAST